jgi:hypothetical protein
MKKILFLTVAFIASQQLFAQIELTPYYGWQWTGSIPMYYYPGYYPSQDAKVEDKANYGIRAGVRLPSHMIAEFEWNHTETNFIYRNIDDQRESIPVSANYYWLGAIRELQEGPVVPYGIFNIGAANFKDMDEGDNITMFAIGFGGGIKYFLSDNIGIRLQARLMAPMMFGGLTFGCGIGTGGSGCGAGAGAYSTIIQGDFTGGIVLKLGTE